MLFWSVSKGWNHHQVSFVSDYIRSKKILCFIHTPSVLSLVWVHTLREFSTVIQLRIMNRLWRTSSVKIPSIGLSLWLTGAFISHSASACMATAGEGERKMESVQQGNPLHPDQIDSSYPGTAVTRLRNVQSRVKSLTPEQLSQDWETVRRSILWAGGLRDLPNARPGKGYTGHSFNDFNHVWSNL